MFLNPNSAFVTHKGEGDTSRGLSPQLWASARAQMASTDGSGGGLYFFDDFLNFQGVTVTTAAGQLQPGGGYFAYIEADATVGSILPVKATAGGTNLPGGVIKLLTSTDTADGDEHQTVLTTGGNAGAMCAVSDTAGDEKLTIFEARWMLPSVTNADGSVYVGMGEEGLAAAATPLAAHALSSKDLIGFAVFEDDNDSLDIVYRKAGQNAQTVATYGTALTAGAFIKTGWVYDPKAPTSQRIKFFINNVDVGTYVTGANIAAATFPDAQMLCPVAGIMGSANNDPQNLYLDWWAVYQEA